MVEGQGLPTVRDDYGTDGLIVWTVKMGKQQATAVAPPEVQLWGKQCFNYDPAAGVQFEGCMLVDSKGCVYAQAVWYYQ